MATLTLEVCCYDIESAVNAMNGGADRVELCADRHLGGTTPSYGVMEVVRKYLKIPVFAMIRPRGGDFLYSTQELEAMIRQPEKIINLLLLKTPSASYFVSWNYPFTSILINGYFC